MVHFFVYTILTSYKALIFLIPPKCNVLLSVIRELMLEKQVSSRTGLRYMKCECFIITGAQLLLPRDMSILTLVL